MSFSTLAIPSLKEGLKVEALAFGYPRMVAGILHTGGGVFLTMGALEQLRKRVLFRVK